MMENNNSSVTWRDGVPVSNQFDDPFYSLDGGLEESRFVFIQGTELKDLLRKETHLTIGETGFGTGLNFLATWQAWRENKNSARITFISAEAFPLKTDDLQKAHAAFPEIDELAVKLREKWPPPSPGYHLITFEGGAIRLLLLFGDAHEMFTKLHGKVDAWYLDGFAPAKNPEMWQDRLFSVMASLSHPETTLATFTAAGFVRRGLTNVGFNMRKTPGFGRKRERLVGKYQPEGLNNKTILPKAKPSWATIGPANHERVAIIGAGIAGLMLGHALKIKGVYSTIYTDTNAANTSTQLPAAILAPKFGLAKKATQYFQNAAFIHAVNHPAYESTDHTDSGTYIVAKNADDKNRLKKIAELYDWPDEWIKPHGDRGFFLQKAKTISPHKLERTLAEGIKIVAANIHSIERAGNGWKLLSEKKSVIDTVDTIIIAAGIESANLLKRSGLAGIQKRLHPELRPNAGQVEVVEADKFVDVSDGAVSYGGYLSAPIQSEEGDQIRCIGSTFERLEFQNRENTGNIASRIERNRETNLKNMNKACNQNITAENVNTSWSGIRATVADHMPFAGPVPDWQDLGRICAPLTIDAKRDLNRAPKNLPGLYLMAGLGSKGFQYAPLLADYIAAMIVDEPIPIPVDMISRLHPARGFVRDIIRNQHE